MDFLSVKQFVVALALGLSISAWGQGPPNVPQQYKRLFYQYSDQRPFYEKALNSAGLTTVPKGRGFALIAGVTQYPNFQVVDRDLKPAAIDIEKLKSYLKDQEYFDEIVVLKDGDFNLDTLNYFLQNYFPEKLANSPHSRFLFAYSGHGYAVGSGDTARGSLLTSSAISKTDPINRIDLDVLRTFLVPDIDAAEKVLVLINACQSGAFLGRKAFGANPLGPGDRGAHAIMASRTNQQSLQVNNVGPGSVFFEKIFAGLEGAADNAPRDGVVTYHELDTYLRSEIPYATGGNQTPMEGDISRNGSIGEFFFLNRGRQVQLGNTKSWNPGNARSFGVAANDLFDLGYTAYKAHNYAEALGHFEDAAQAGNVSAQSMLGYMYFAGQGVPTDRNTARSWFEKAADAGDSLSMTNLGVLYELGSGVPRDYQLARSWYEKAVAVGSAPAMSNLGVLYQNGTGVPLDYQKAREWFEKSAAAGNARGMFLLGRLYSLGNGVPQDYTKARRWFDRGAAAGDPASMNGIGVMYGQGQGTPQDYTQARQWYEKAAAAGDSTAMYNLGILYEYGHGLPSDHAQAHQWYEKAVAAGDTDAGDRLNKMNGTDLYSRGYAAYLTHNYEKALDLFHQAADAGHSDAQLMLGYMSDRGFGVPQDDAQARIWYQKAADKGNATAMANLGVLYQEGQGGAQDYQLARQRFETAAAGGNASAMFSLGRMYEYGLGIPKDYAKAKEWFERGAAAGDAAAMRGMGVLYAGGEGVPQDYAQSLGWYEKAANAGDAVAMNNLGLLYEFGNGVPRNYSQARLWYGKAVTAGYTQASDRLKGLPQ